jgi:hypothetical protein
LNPRGGFIPLPLSRRVPWTGLGDASQINGRSIQISKHYLCAQNSFKSRAEGVGFEPTRSVNPFRFSRPVPSATRRALRFQSFQIGPVHTLVGDDKLIFILFEFQKALREHQFFQTKRHSKLVLHFQLLALRVR